MFECVRNWELCVCEGLDVCVYERERECRAMCVTNWGLCVCVCVLSRERGGGVGVLGAVCVRLRSKCGLVKDDVYVRKREEKCWGLYMCG